MKKKLSLFLSLLLVTICKSQESYHLNYGIWTETIDTLDKNPLKYSIDNSIYKPGSIFTYSLKIQNKIQNEVVCNFSEKTNTLDPAGFKSWDLVDKSQKDTTTLEYISVRVVKDPLNMELSAYDSKYTQTYIWIDYKNSQKVTFGYRMDSTHWNPEFRGRFIPGGDLTGVIENKKNIWMHPPRTKFFRINQLNPYPFIQFPINVGEKWSWNLKIGGHWGDNRWAEWKGNVEVKSDYEITEKTTRQTRLGILDCYRVECVGNSPLGITHLTYYFNPEYGFIYMEYTNIDKSKTILELIEKS